MRTRFVPHGVRPFKSVPHRLPEGRAKESVVVQAFRPAVAGRPEGLHYDRIFVVVWLLALLLTPIPPAAAQAPAAPPANADEGRKLFVSYGCYQCHGYEGQGSSATGPRLGPRPLPLASFSRYVRRPTGQMPPYTTKVASDSDLAKIHAFLEARPAPPAVDTIPQLK